MELIKNSAPLFHFIDLNQNHLCHCYNQLKKMCYFYLENKKDFKEKVQISNQDEIEDINDKEFIISNCYVNRNLMKKIVL